MPFVHLLNCEPREARTHGSSSRDLRLRSLSRLSTGPGSGFVVRNLCERASARQKDAEGRSLEAVHAYARSTAMLRPRDLLLFSDSHALFNQPLTLHNLVERFDAARGERRIVFSAEAFCYASSSRGTRSTATICPHETLRDYREHWIDRNRSAELSGEHFPREGAPYYCPR